ncbi:MAG TPA: hypothetical protein VK034_25230 [Enhygromyxa sp.]|nr:hypothetical protein [Enhygromyxa sp.]
MPRRLGLALASTLLLLAACNDDITVEPDPEPEPEVYRYAYATGIRLTRMTVNQAVQVDLVTGNDILAPDDYPVPLIEGRATLVRAHYLVHAEFEPRELLAQLTVRYPEPITIGSGDEAQTIDTFVDESRVMVDGDSVDGSLQRSFAWYLLPEYVVDGMSLRVDVYEPEPYGEQEQVPEPDPDAVGPERIDAPALPWAQNSATITADEDPMEIEVVLVPIEHHFEDCVSDASVPDTERDAMRRELEQNNPVHRAVVSVREPMIYTDPIGGSEMGFSPILSKLSQLHVEDGADPWVYYYGLITTCDGYPGGLLGQAFGIPQELDPGLGYQRVSAGRYFGSGQAAAETFVHEVGHSQGRRHVRCAGEAGVDSNYPHIGGITGVWGFGIYDLRLRSPAGSRDYMTYCANEWVSDYGYNLVWPVIETLTQWSREGQPDGEDGLRSRSWSSQDFDEILIGALYPNGTIEWWTTRGSISGTMSSHAAVRWELDGESLSLPIWISPRGDDETLNLATVLPEGGLDGARFELELGVADLEGIVPTVETVELDLLHRAGH